MQRAARQQDRQEVVHPLPVAGQHFPGQLLLRRPDGAEGLRAWLGKRVGQPLTGLDPEEWERLVNDVRYEGFLRRERETLERVRRSEERKLPAGLRYAGIPGLSAEAAEKLERHRPRTLGQAARIPGVTPAAVSLLLARLVAREKGAAA